MRISTFRNKREKTEKMIEIGKHYDPIQIFTAKGDPDEIIGKNAKEPKWRNITELGYGLKYKGTIQSIPINTINTSLRIPTLKVSSDKSERTLSYVIPKEVLQILANRDLPFSETVDLPFTLENYVFNDSVLDMTGLFWSCVQNGSLSDSIVKFYRKRYKKWISFSRTVSCKRPIIADSKLYYTETSHEPVSEMVDSFKVYYDPVFALTFKKFQKELSKYGEWTTEKTFPSENEYCLINYKLLTPSQNYINLRKDSDVYKNWKKENKSDEDFKYRQETAIDLLQGLGAALDHNNTLTVWLQQENGTWKDVYHFEGSMDNNRNNENGFKSAFMSRMIPVVKNAICTTKNEKNHIWNFYDFLNSDFVIDIKYSEGDMLTGNLVDVKVPENIESSDVLLESFVQSLENSISKLSEGFQEDFKEGFSVAEMVNGIKSSISAAGAKISEMNANLKKKLEEAERVRKIETERKNKSFLRNDEYIKSLCELDKKGFMWAPALTTELTKLVSKFDNESLDSEARNDLKEAYEKAKNNDFTGSEFQSVSGRYFIFRHLLIKYFSRYFNQLTERSLKTPSRNFTNGKFYESSKHPLLVQTVDVPALKWFSEKSVEYCSEAMKKIIIPGIVNRLSEKIKSGNEESLKLKKEFILQKYLNQVHEKSRTGLNLTEFPILSVLGVFDDSSFMTLNGENIIDSSEKSQQDEQNEKLKNEMKNKKNSIFTFNSNIFQNFQFWNNSKHLQINIPKWNQSVKTFLQNSETITVSFPTTYEDINTSAIQFVSEDSKLKLKEDGNWIEFFQFSVKRLADGDFSDVSVTVFIPKQFKNIKYIERTIGTFKTYSILIAFYKDGSMTVPYQFQNYGI